MLEEPTPAYRGFLRSGSYPALSLRLRRSGELAGRVASLVALAALAAGIGYKLTQRVVTSGGPSAASHGAPAEPLPSTRHGIGALSVAHSTDLMPPPEPSQRPAASVQPLAAASVHTRANLKTDGVRPLSQVAQERPVRRKSGESEAGAADTSSRPAPSAAAAQARTELIAERVRALDEAAHARPSNNTPDVGSAARAAPKVVPSEPVALAVVPSVKAPVAPEPARAAPLRAATSIVDLDVRGSLSASSVRHGVERVRPAFASCYAQAAQQAKRNEFGSVQMRFTIDETGRTRAPKVANAPLPGLEECLRSAIGKLVCRAPDTGTVQAALLVKFTP
jgi:hypothetical protein